MRPWQFSKPKNPGFGLSTSYYLTVLCSKSVMPSIYEIINPSGEGGAVMGFGAPLTAPSTDKTLLHQRIERGAYVVAAKDRKSVMKMLVMSPEEAGFNPEVFAQSMLAQNTDPEIVTRIRATWHLAQFRFESHDAMVYPALDLILSVVTRLAHAGDGVVADPISQRYLLPHQVIQPERFDPRVDVREHISVKFRTRPDGIHAYTLGHQKFNLPEHEILNLFPEDQVLAEAFLMTLSQKVLVGDLTKAGELFGAPKQPFQASAGGFDQALWNELPVFELLPPTASTAGEALRAWAALSPTV